MLGKRQNVWKGTAAGVVAGIVASGSMNLFQLLWNMLVADRRTRRGSPANTQEPDTTVKAASAISEGILRHRLTAKEKRIGGSAVHYVLGGAMGALYGTLAERHPRVSAGSGLPFGVVFWLAVDEIAVPVLRLSRPPRRYPVSVHVYALASHLVFGATAEAVRRAVKSKL